jgi:hypothetical protein
VFVSSVEKQPSLSLKIFILAEKSFAAKRGSSTQGVEEKVVLSCVAACDISSQKRLRRRHDIQHDDTQHNDTQHNGLVCDTRHN